MNPKKLDDVVSFANSAVSFADKRHDAFQYLRALQQQGIQTASVEELLAILR
jgi:hypothetical protein